MQIEVVLMPVSVLPSREAQVGPRVVGFHLDGGWPSATVTRGGARQAVSGLIERLPTEHRLVIDERGIEPEAVAFKEADKAVTLIYSIALPMPLAEVEVEEGAWIPLLAPAVKWTDAKRHGSGAVSKERGAELMLEWWAERLEENSALFLFLPRHFTSRQARDIYSAFWGYEQDADGFATWSGIGAKKDGALSDLVEPTDDMDLEKRIDELTRTIERASVSSSTGALDATAARMLALFSTKDGFGVDPAVELADSIDGGRRTLTIASALAAYQPRARGPKPRWFRRADDTVVHKERLKSLYSTRPSWIYPAGT